MPSSLQETSYYSLQVLSSEFCGLSKITNGLLFQARKLSTSQKQKPVIIWCFCYRFEREFSAVIYLVFLTDFDSFMSVGEMIVSNARRKSVSDIIDHPIPCCGVLFMAPDSLLRIVFGLNKMLDSVFFSFLILFHCRYCSLTGMELCF